MIKESSRGYIKYIYKGVERGFEVSSVKQSGNILTICIYSNEFQGIESELFKYNLEHKEWLACIGENEYSDPIWHIMDSNTLQILDFNYSYEYKLDVTK